MELTQFRKLITETIGLQLRPQDNDRLQAAVEDRCKRRNLSSVDAYVQSLVEDTDQAAQEWCHLATLLTTGETFFFRAQDQMDLLANVLLPEIIKCRHGQRRLKLWSAGCSSGEEPYTLAMLIDQLLPDRTAWQIDILATDIDAAALEKARRGVYTDWSFRNVDAPVQAKYFQRQGSHWEVASHIKSLVTFDTFNLVKDSFAASHLRDMDIILCRNVFIYFQRTDVCVVSDKLAAALRNGGYLMTGHAELRGHRPGSLCVEVFPESVVYKNAESPKGEGNPIAPPLESGAPFSSSEQPKGSGHSTTAPANQAPGTARSPAVQIDKSIDELIENTQRLLNGGAHAEALLEATRIVDAKPNNARGHSLLAQAHANLGDHQKAIDSRARATELDSFATEPQYLMAHIAQEQNRYDDAMKFLKQVLYLSPSHIPAHLSLAELHDREGDVQQVQSLRLAALNHLRTVPANTQIDYHGSVTAHELVAQLEQVTQPLSR